MVPLAIAAGVLLAGCSTAQVTQPAAPRPGSTQVAPTGIPVQGSELTEPRQSLPPIRVQVPSVEIDVVIEPVGVQPDGLMELPANTDIAGWYEYGPDPSSETGTTVLAAHVDSLEFGLGPFSRLRDLQAGAEVIVTTSDGVTHSYVTEGVTKVLKSELPLAEVFDRAGAPRLVMITCGGQFDYDTLHYSDNVVASATPAG